MNKYPYAIFDMDGTLVDSMPYWHNIGRDYLISRGCVPEEGLWEKLSTMSTEETALYFKKEYHLPDEPSVIVDGFNSIMEENYRTRIPAKPGVPEYLRMLYEAGVTLSICSATSLPLVKLTLKRLHLDSYFSVLTSCDEVDAGKDRPDVFLLALSRLNARPEEAVMYEDADFGIRTAKSLGMHVAAVYDPSCLSSPEEIRKIADFYIEDYSKLDFCPQDIR